ncbi:E3 ubiquitin-protein ligase znrf1 isoform X1 [Hypanus sabinus]|uniref:E3 ubiquitin-protein ligase znrf1 isoform X1 n=1 Tax=Hypanus sabinus TaxID=79690 RepID=UPI0028C43D7E|nr:E3 ubiquitin-protein ligase znrf1 isoform X1 [Hypanus sabinus]
MLKPVVMGGKQSTAARSRTAFPGVSTDDSAVHAAHYGHYRSGVNTMGLRTRSVSSVAGMEPAHPFGLYGSGARPGGGGSGGSRAGDGGEQGGGTAGGGGGGGGVGGSGGPAAGPDPAGNGYQETGGGPGARELQLYLGSRAAALSDSLPLHLAPRWFSAHSGFKCPICSKSVASDEMEMHFIMCLSKPRLSYNDDVLSKDAGECVICLEELLQGDTIARLPCLCIYHKSCIDSWFEVNRSCPEHPSD